MSVIGPVYLLVLYAIVLFVTRVEVACMMCTVYAAVLAGRDRDSWSFYCLIVVEKACRADLLYFHVYDFT